MKTKLSVEKFLPAKNPILSVSQKVVLLKWNIKEKQMK